MPLRNRVDPFGELHAVNARGRLMGNRGCLLDDRGEIVRRSATKAWITCVTEWPGRAKRPLASPDHYTPLFFLDEATALAAGHRPCGECRKDALGRFKLAWGAATRSDGLVSAREIDAVLATQRGHWPTCAAPEDLPDGAMVADDQHRPWLRKDGEWQTWSFEGYGKPGMLPSGRIRLLTPVATIAALAAGYRLES